MNILLIDTRDSEKINVAFERDGERFELASIRAKSQVTLSLIEKLFKKHHLSLSDIDHIQVEKGPGSFTGLKVGMAIANALSFSLLVPVNKRELGEVEVPQY